MKITYEVLSMRNARKGSGLEAEVRVTRSSWFGLVVKSYDLICMGSSLWRHYPSGERVSHGLWTVLTNAREQRKRGVRFTDESLD